MRTIFVIFQILLQYFENWNVSWNLIIFSFIITFCKNYSTKKLGYELFLAIIQVWQTKDYINIVFWQVILNTNIIVSIKMIKNSCLYKSLFQSSEVILIIQSYITYNFTHFSIYLIMLLFSNNQNQWLICKSIIKPLLISFVW